MRERERKDSLRQKERECERGRLKEGGNNKERERREKLLEEVAENFIIK